MSPWSLQRVPIRFQIGDRTLWQVRLPLQVSSVSLSDRLAPATDPSPPAALVPGPAVGWYLRALPVAAELPRLARTGDHIRYVPLQYFHCYVDLSIGFEAYCAKFSSKTRSTIKRKLRKYQEHCGGTLHWTCHRTPEEMQDFHRMARRVSEVSYQERLLDAGIPDGDEFVRGMQAAAAQDAVRGYVLYDGGRPVSYLYCPVHDDALVYAYLGYDPEYAAHSVGTVLQWLALESIFAEQRFAFFDFTEGQSDHKRLFATHETRCANVMFVRWSPARLLLLHAHARSDAISAALGRWAERMGIKSRLRRLLRFGLRGAG